MSNTRTSYYILSPDGFSINFDSDNPTPEKAWEEFELWKQGYARQGYYASVKNGNRIRIPLEQLKEHCVLTNRTI